MKYQFPCNVYAETKKSENGRDVGQKCIIILLFMSNISRKLNYQKENTTYKIWSETVAMEWLLNFKPGSVCRV